MYNNTLLFNKNELKRTITQNKNYRNNIKNLCLPKRGILAQQNKKPGS